MLWIARTGGPWRDLPAVFGKWNTVLAKLVVVILSLAFVHPQNENRGVDPLACKEYGIAKNLEF